MHLQFAVAMNLPVSTTIVYASRERVAGPIGHQRRLRSLVSLFTLYAVALALVILLSDGGDIGCILAGIAGHVLYAAGKSIRDWYEAIAIDEARIRAWQRRFSEV